MSDVVIKLPFFMEGDPVLQRLQKHRGVTWLNFARPYLLPVHLGRFENHPSSCTQSPHPSEEQ